MARIEKVIVSGVFSVDGQEFDFDNNVWLVGGCVVHDDPLTDRLQTRTGAAPDAQTSPQRPVARGWRPGVGV